MTSISRRRGIEGVGVAPTLSLGRDSAAHHRRRFWQDHAIQQLQVPSLLLVSSALLLGCAYAAKDPPSAWARIDDDKPARKPDVPYEPSSSEAIAAMIELAAAGPSDVVYDLGCGDGRVVIEAVKRSGARGVCVDIDPKLIRQAQGNAARAGVAERIRFRTEDLFVTDIHDASVVMLFLWPEINLRLLPKLRRELPGGARIVSNMHDMGTFQPTRIIPLRSSRHRSHQVYLWLLPASGVDSSR